MPFSSPRTTSPSAILRASITPWWSAFRGRSSRSHPPADITSTPWTSTSTTLRTKARCPCNPTLSFPCASSSSAAERASSPLKKLSPTAVCAWCIRPTSMSPGRRMSLFWETCTESFWSSRKRKPGSLQRPWKSTSAAPSMSLTTGPT